MGLQAENFGAGLIISGETNPKSSSFSTKPYYEVPRSFDWNSPLVDECLPLNSVLNPIKLYPSGK